MWLELKGKLKNTGYVPENSSIIDRLLSLLFPSPSTFTSISAIFVYDSRSYVHSSKLMYAIWKLGLLGSPAYSVLELVVCYYTVDA